MPYPNEHSCRMRDPGDFQADSFRSKDSEINGKPVRLILGRLKGEDTMTLQAYRYPSDKWTADEARADCKTHKGILFEPASPGTENKASRFWSFRGGVEEKTGELLLYGDIGSAQVWGDELTPTQIDAELKALGEIDTLNVYVNSAGGSAFAGMAIYNIIKRFKARVKNAYVDGLAGSIASVIVMACDKVFMPSNAMLVIHNPMGLVMGNAGEMRKMAGALDKVRETILAVYREKTGKTDEALIPLLDAETWMTAKQAITLGFADEMQAEVKIAASLDGSFLTFGGVKVDTSAFKNFKSAQIETYREKVEEDINEMKNQQKRFTDIKLKLLAASGQ